jgi:hypothetical protein
LALRGFIGHYQVRLIFLFQLLNSICLTPFSLIIQARKSIKTLKAQIDVENIGSRKVIAKIGAREGETRLKSYELARDRGADGKVPEEKRRDMVWWYVC